MFRNDMCRLIHVSTPSLLVDGPLQVAVEFAYRLVEQDSDSFDSGCTPESLPSSASPTWVLGSTIRSSTVDKRRRRRQDVLHQPSATRRAERPVAAHWQKRRRLRRSRCAH